MKRLTFDGNYCDIAQCAETRGGSFCEDGACSQRKVWERLKEWEDLEEQGRVIVMKKPEQDSMARLRELADADRDGRLVMLPCKVGDELWTFCSHPVEQVYSFTVTDISTLNGRTMLNTSRCGVIDARDVGKTVFLTREEAEKALEEMKERKDDFGGDVIRALKERMETHD